MYWSLQCIHRFGMYFDAWNVIQIGHTVINVFFLGLPISMYSSSYTVVHSVWHESISGGYDNCTVIFAISLEPLLFDPLKLVSHTHQTKHRPRPNSILSLQNSVQSLQKFPEIKYKWVCVTWASIEGPSWPPRLYLLQSVWNLIRIREIWFPLLSVEHKEPKYELLIHWVPDFSWTHPKWAPGPWGLYLGPVAAGQLCLWAGAPSTSPGPLVANLLHLLLVVAKLEAHVYDAADPVLVEGHL